jgi:hypothetical protein
MIYSRFNLITITIFSISILQFMITIFRFHYYNILNSRLQYLDFTIAIATNQYLQSPSRLWFAPHADDHNSSPGSASQRWVGREHGGTRVTHEDRGHEAAECEPRRDPDCGVAAHVLGSTKRRRIGSGMRMIRSTNGGGTWTHLWLTSSGRWTVMKGDELTAVAASSWWWQRSWACRGIHVVHQSVAREEVLPSPNRSRRTMIGSMNVDRGGWSAAAVSTKFLAAQGGFGSAAKGDAANGRETQDECGGGGLNSDIVRRSQGVRNGWTSLCVVGSMLRIHLCSA